MNHVFKGYIFMVRQMYKFLVMATKLSRPADTNIQLLLTQIDCYSCVYRFQFDKKYLKMPKTTCPKTTKIAHTG